MKTYIIIKDNKLINYLYADKKPTNGYEVTKFCGWIGHKISYYADNYSRVKSEAELLTDGIKKVYYNTDTQQEQIFDVQEVPDTYTDKKPLTQYDDWNGTKWVYNKDKHIADKIQQVKEECKRFIYSLYPIEKQLQMTFQYNKILKTALERELTPDEEASKLHLENLHAWYEGIIAQSHAMEADITGLTTHEDIEAYDITFKE